MACFFVRPIGFNESQLGWLESLFTIAQGRLKQEWRWVVQGYADAYLIAVGSVPQWGDCLADYPPDRLIACVPPNLEIDAVWRIPTAQEKTPGLPELIRILNAMGGQLAAGAQTLAGISAEFPPLPVDDSLPLSVEENPSELAETEMIVQPEVSLGMEETTPFSDDPLDESFELEMIVQPEVSLGMGETVPASDDPLDESFELEMIVQPEVSLGMGETVPASDDPLDESFELEMIVPPEVSVERGEVSSLPASSEPKPAEPPGESPEPDRIATSADSRVYDWKNYLPGLVYEARADGIPRRLVCGDEGEALLIDPDARRYFVPGDMLSLWPILSAPCRLIEVRPLNHADFAREVLAIRSQGLVLDELVFLSALVGSKGRLWAGCQPDEPVRLRQWPDLKNLGQFPDSVEYVRVAAFMSGNAADVKTIAANTRVSEDKVINFHNAFEALGLLERGRAEPVRDQVADLKIRNFYQKIAMRFKS